MTVQHERLLGTWVHSHEEDHDGEMVFRPSTFAFPLSRGRRSFEFASDGGLIESGPGPVDRTQRRQGRWTREGNELVVTTPDRSPQRFRIAAADADRLVLRELGS